MPQDPRPDPTHAGSRSPEAAGFVIEDLAREDVLALLARNSVGRIAFTMRDRVDIEPIHYVYSDGWLYARTSRGAKVATLERNRWVAFEVDEIFGPSSWSSAVVHGAVYFLEPNGSPDAAQLWSRAIALLKRLVPQTLEPGDPVPHRDIVFRIAVQEATGRRARAAEG